MPGGQHRFRKRGQVRKALTDVLRNRATRVDQCRDTAGVERPQHRSHRPIAEVHIEERGVEGWIVLEELARLTDGLDVRSDDILSIFWPSNPPLRCDADPVAAVGL